MARFTGTLVDQESPADKPFTNYGGFASASTKAKAPRFSGTPVSGYGQDDEAMFGAPEREPYRLLEEKVRGQMVEEEPVGIDPQIQEIYDEFPDYTDFIEKKLKFGAILPDQLRKAVLAEIAKKRKEAIDKLRSKHLEYAETINEMDFDGMEPADIEEQVSYLINQKKVAEEQKKLAEQQRKEQEADLKAQTDLVKLDAKQQADLSKEAAKAETAAIKFETAAIPNVLQQPTLEAVNKQVEKVNKEAEFKKELEKRYGKSFVDSYEAIAAKNPTLAWASTKLRAAIESGDESTVNRIRPIVRDMLRMQRLGEEGTAQYEEAMSNLQKTADALGYGRAALSSITFGLAGRPIDKLVQAVSGETEFEIGEYQSGLGKAGAIGVEVAGGLASAGRAIAGAGKILPAATTVPGAVAQRAGVQAGIGGVQSTVNSLNAVSRGEITADEAKANIVAGVLSSAIAAPIAAGVPGKLKNAVAQVAGDLMVDLASDAAFTDYLKDDGFVDWFLTRELPNLVVSAAGAGIDLKGAYQQKQEIRRLVRDGLTRTINLDKGGGIPREVPATAPEASRQALAQQRLEEESAQMARTAEELDVAAQEAIRRGERAPTERMLPERTTRFLAPEEGPAIERGAAPVPPRTTVTLNKQEYALTADDEWVNTKTNLRVKSKAQIEKLNALANIPLDERQVIQEKASAIPIRETETIPVGEGAGGRAPMDQGVREQAAPEDQIKAQAEVVPKEDLIRPGSRVNITMMEGGGTYTIERVNPDGTVDVRDQGNRPMQVRRTRIYGLDEPKPRIDSTGNIIEARPSFAPIPEAPISRQREEVPVEAGVPAAEAEMPGYKAARDPLIARAAELGLDTKGTTAELQSRIAKREKVLSFIDGVEAGAKQRLAELQKTTTLGANKPLGMATEYVILGAAKMARGTIKFADWSREMVGEFGEAIKPYLRQIYQRAITINRKDFNTPEEFRAFSEKIAGGFKLKTKDVPSLEVSAPIPQASTTTQREAGLRNAVSEAERREFDLTLPPEPIQKEMEVEWNRSEEKMAQDPQAGKRLTDDLQNNPSRAMNDEESALLLRHKRKLATELDDASRAVDAAKTESEQADAKTRFDEALAEYERVINVAQTAGTQWGRAGVWRQMVAKEDYSLARMLTKAKSANGGKDLTPERKAQITAQNKRITELQAKIDELESRRGSETVAKITAEENVKKGRGQKPTFEEEPPVNAAKMGQSIKDLARYFVGKGVTNRTELVKRIHEVVVKVDPELTPRDVQDAFSDYGKFRQLSKDEIDVKLRDLRQQLQQVSKLEDMEAGTAPKKTGMERQAPSDEARRLIQQVNEAKKRGGYDITDPERQLASAMQTIKKRLTDQIADLEYQIKTRTKIVKEKRGIEYDAEAKALQARRDELRQEFDAIFGRPEMTDEQRVNQALSAINRSIEDLNRRIQTGDLFPTKKPSKTPETPEIAAARAEREALREQLKELQLIARPKKTPEEISMQAYKTRVKNQIAELQRKKAAGDFTTKPKKERVMDPEATELYYQLDKAKREYNEALVEDRLKNRTVFKKIIGNTIEAHNFARAIMTSLDLSGLLRQGGMLAISRPIKAIKALPQMFKAAVSEKAAFAALEEIRRRPSYKAMKSAGLELTEPTSTLASVEEAFQSRLVEKFPALLGGGIVRGSQRAYTTILNRLRADAFDAMSQTLTRTGSPTPEEAKQIAKYVNVASGRGDIPPNWAATARGLNTVLFAPRYAVSRFQAILGTPLWSGNARTRKLIAMEYARYLSGIGTIYGMAALRNQLTEKEEDKWTIELDPRSSDFGKIKMGNTRLDPLSGLAQATVFLTRLATGETKTIAGKEKVIRDINRPLNLLREDTDPMRVQTREFVQSPMSGVMGRFLRSKLSPAFGVGVSLLEGKGYFEEEDRPFGAKEAVQQLFTPLTVKDIYNTMLEQGVPRGSALALLALFGVSVQTYKPKEPKEKEPSSSGVRFAK